MENINMVKTTFTAHDGMVQTCSPLPDIMNKEFKSLPAYALKVSAGIIAFALVENESAAVGSLAVITLTGVLEEYT
jgi:hypothetical protein